MIRMGGSFPKEDTHDPDTDGLAERITEASFPVPIVGIGVVHASEDSKQLPRIVFEKRFPGYTNSRAARYIVTRK